MAKGRLYMIPCPISDGDPYSVLPSVNGEIMRGLDYFIVENVRTTRRFLSSASIGKPIDSLLFAECSEHTQPQEMEELIKPILQGRDAGVISEAGLPGIADPGADVARLCHKHGIEVIPLVGPSSIIMALMASGQNGQSFAFNGYLPIKPPERSKALKSFERRAQSERQAQIFIEAPYRNSKLLDQMLTTLSSETILTVAADITAPTEYIRSLSVKSWRTAQRPDINKRPAIFIIGV